MARTPSPLRYPGGKTALLGTVSALLRANALDRGCYVEPFAGGGGLALSLLFKGDVGEIYLNDVDPAIAALWRSICGRSEEFIALMRETPVTLAERERQREIYLERDKDDVKLGFATLFLNRVNRSGIIRTGGVIGGKEQKGSYLIDCRFNKEELEARIKRISRYRKRIHFTSMDASVFLKTIVSDMPAGTFVYADPPYYEKGAELYTSSFKPDDHLSFGQALMAVRKPWMLTYDDVPQIKTIYATLRQYQIDLNYSAQTKRLGRELLIVSKGLKVPSVLKDQMISQPQYRKQKAAAVGLLDRSSPERDHLPHAVHSQTDLSGFATV